MSYITLGAVSDSDPTIVAFHNEMNRYAAWQKLPPLPAGGVGVNTIGYFINLKNQPDAPVHVKAVNTAGTTTAQRTAIMNAIAGGQLTPAIKMYVDGKTSLIGAAVSAVTGTAPPVPPPGPPGTQAVTVVDNKTGVAEVRYLDPSGAQVGPAVAVTNSPPPGAPPGPKGMLTPTIMTVAAVGIAAALLYFTMNMKKSSPSPAPKPVTP